MFQKQEIERLRQRKAELVLQSEENRRQLAADWQRLSSAGFWLNAGQDAVRRHPGLMAGLAAAGGVLAVRLIRNSGGATGTWGRIGRLLPVALTVWRLFRKQRDKKEEV
jgi:hypothetical protein